MLRTIVLMCILVVFVSGETTQVFQCMNNAGVLPINTYIEGCITPPCLLPQLQDAVLHVEFQAPREIRSMRTLATAYVSLGILTIPFQHDLGVNAVTCDFLTNASCPVSNGEIVQHTLKLFIEPFFPVGTQVNTEFRVVDENNVPLFCFRIPLRVVQPLSMNDPILTIESVH